MSIDRIEEGFAVCQAESGKTINILVENISGNPHPGDILKKDRENSYIILESDTKIARNKNISLLERLRAKAKKR